VTFANPAYLWFFVFVPVMLTIHFISIRNVERKAMLFANYKAMEKVFGKKILSRNYPLLFIRILTLVFFIFAVSGTSLVYEGPVGEMDFTLSIDASASMLANDYTPSRLAAAKSAALLFADAVPEGTQVGVVSFAGAGFVKQELTQDTESVKNAIEGVDIEISGGTAIGEAIVSSTNLLMGSGKKKVVVLITDGQNNVGIGVEGALEYAGEHRTTVHTIGIGTEEGGVVGNTSFIAGLDTETLQTIAERTGGRYYRAETAGELESVFAEIASSTLEEIRMDISSYLLITALLLFLLELVLVNSKYRTIP
jgi:Ca-activated chloride channel family protein